MRGHHIVHGVVLSLLLALVAFAQDQAARAKNTTSVTVTVTDRDHHPVTALQPDSFTLYEDGHQQAIAAVASGDLPACVGILVDRSGSMRGKHRAIAAAMADFVRTGNPGNKYFVVTFNDDVKLEQDFTADAALVEQVIAGAEARGGTAFYDAVIATADHLAEAGSCQKRVLVLLSDGVDNESQKTLDYTAHALQEDGNPLVYAIGLQDRSGLFKARSKRALDGLTAPSGGTAILIGDSGEFSRAAHRIADEIRSQYMLILAQPNISNPETKVMVRSADRKELSAHVNVPRRPSVSAAAASAQAQGSACITGAVLDENKKSVPGISVEAWPTFSRDSTLKDSSITTITDEGGKFKFAQLQPGIYYLYTKNEGAGYPPTKTPFYQLEYLPSALAGEKCADATIRVGPKAARLKMNVVDAATGAPLQRFGASFRKPSGSMLVINGMVPGQEIMVPPNTELRISAWAYHHPRSEPIVVTTPSSEASQDVMVQLNQVGQ